MKKLFIIDGSAYLYRAYYALPEMTGPDGTNVNAIYGFTKMILKLFEQSPDYFLLAWDAPQKTLRHEMFSDYKANRKPAPDDFKAQIGQAKELIKNIGVPVLELPGYEADDIIATVANKAKDTENVHSFIYSSDKDLKQLLDYTTTFVDPMKGVETTPTEFVAHYGFKPIYIVDYLSLVGDASDNVPGVKGIGKKGATNLIKEYKTLDGIYENIESITGSTKQKLIDGKDSAYHSKKLIELMEVPGVVDTAVDSYDYTLDFSVMEKELFDHYHFSSMQKQIDKLKKIMQTPQMVSLFG